MQSQNNPVTSQIMSQANVRRVIQFHGLFLVVWLVGTMPIASAQYEVMQHVGDADALPFETVDDGYIHGEVDPGGYTIGQSPVPGTPHRVLRSPSPNPLRAPQQGASLGGVDASGAASHRSHHADAKSTAKRIAHDTIHTDGPLLRHLHELKQPAQATIPDAVVQPQWKAPYAYGYFGASGTKSWTMTYGYRDTYKRWTKQ